MNGKSLSGKLLSAIAITVLCAYQSIVPSSAAAMQDELADALMASVNIFTFATFEEDGEMVQCEQDGRGVGGIGSGTSIDENGTILTNDHVIDISDFEDLCENKPRNAELEPLYLVSFPDEKGQARYTYTASEIASKRTSVVDLGLLKIEEFDPNSDEKQPYEAGEFPWVPLGDSEDIGLGDPITILGYPGAVQIDYSRTALNLAHGYVTSLQLDDDGDIVRIVTDADVSGGNSGGTAINEDGELIGIPTEASALRCEDEVCDGDSYGFLIPVDMAQAFIDDELADGDNDSSENDDDKDDQASEDEPESASEDEDNLEDEASSIGLTLMTCFDQDEELIDSDSKNEVDAEDCAILAVGFDGSDLPEGVEYQVDFYLDDEPFFTYGPYAWDGGYEGTGGGFLEFEEGEGTVGEWTANILIEGEVVATVHLELV